MPRRLTFDYVKTEFEKECYILLSSVYINAHTKLKFICPNNHKYSITWNGWKKGNRCLYCTTNIKKTIEEIRNAFEFEGYTLLSKEYVNAHTKLEYTCPEGHSHSIVWGSWYLGRRCPYCSRKAIKNIKDIAVSFSDAGYKLLSKKYINSKTKLEYICPEGHNNFISWSNWNQGFRCPTCANLSMFGAGNPSWKGGLSFEPYCEAWKDKEYKQAIRNRDGNKCLNPYCDSKNPNDLTIHHIDYDKKNCHPSNLITVCRSCNSKANKDRKWHKVWYQSIVYKRGIV